MFQVDERIPLKGYWYKVKAVDGAEVTLKRQEATSKAVKKFSRRTVRLRKKP
jgi:hypothetical protein